MPDAQATAVIPPGLVTFGAFLKYLRRRAQLTQAELAIACGYSSPHISHLENNQRLPDHATLLALFVPALGIQDEPRLVERLLELAAQVQEETPAPGEAPQGASLAHKNLLSPCTPFIGRLEELTRLASLLNDSSCRLLTLTGPGGSGKTRLALQAATQQKPVFPHGVFFVSLVGVASPHFIVSTIADALGFSFKGVTGAGPASTDALGASAGGGDTKTQLLDYLRGKSLLLVIDNVEHLLEGVELFADILRDAPTVKILATSRERLALQEEWVFAVDGLDVPSGHPARSLETYSAVQLFVERARHVKLDFSLPDNAAAVSRICQQVEGMPLGIELAAGLLRAMPIVEIADQIGHNLDLLTTSLRDVPERHRSLRAVFEQSRDQLSDVEHAALIRLSVFRGGFRGEAAVYVMEAPFRVQLALVEKSLVRLNPSGRYDMHDLLRQFAEERLRAANDYDATCDRHLEYYVRLAEETEPKLLRAEQLDVLAMLEREYDNFRTALDWSHTRPRSAELELRLAASLLTFWLMNGHYDEGRRWLDEALARPEAVAAPPLALANAFRARGDFGWRSGDPDTKRYCETALALYREVGDLHGLALGLYEAGYTTSDPVQSEMLLQEGLVLARSVGDVATSVNILVALGRRDFRQGKTAEALTSLEEALVLSRGTGGRWSIAVVEGTLGQIWSEEGDYTRAETLIDDAIRLTRELGGRNPGLPYCLTLKAEIARIHGDMRLARSLYEEIEALHAQTSGPWKGGTQFSLGYVEISEGNLVAARAHFEEHLRSCRGIDGWEMAVPYALVGLAALASALGHPRRAIQLYAAAETHLEPTPGRINGAEQLWYERDAAAALAEIGEATFNAAYAEGQRMTLEAAIAYAME